MVIISEGWKGVVGHRNEWTGCKIQGPGTRERGTAKMGYSGEVLLGEFRLGLRRKEMGERDGSLGGEVVIWKPPVHPASAEREHYATQLTTKQGTYLDFKL
ncbi:Hypothetical predicted protein [Mytilus galloprovincialis]|uniref:Uncharacterized protein n=1 Tax=Mytilus galloprovincialis TaxID=29158 RepID=A0A8B6HFR2_MYTGA|nr:Hypothetical predicted protein [Mytilus galloprovincialis]